MAPGFEVEKAATAAREAAIMEALRPDSKVVMAGEREWAPVGGTGVEPEVGVGVGVGGPRGESRSESSL